MIDFKEAYAQAFAVAEKSNDPHTKVGAVLICKPSVTPSGHEFPPPRIIGCNEIKGDDPASFERPLKYDRVIHAEVAVITGAAAHGISTFQATLVLTHPPCLECAKVICAAGISELHVGPCTYTSRTPEADVAAEYLLRRYGVTLTHWAGVRSH